jgi:hypothetical protein
MRKSKMETDEFLGPFPSMLKVDKYQHMVYQGGDLGPFVKMDAKRQASKFDSLTGTSKRKIRRKDATEKDLRAKGVRAKGNKIAIVEVCKQNDDEMMIMMMLLVVGCSQCYKHPPPLAL